MAGPSDTDVIAAVGTAPGRAGIGIVRVSGKKLEQLASHLLGSVPAPRLAVRAAFPHTAGEPMDDSDEVDREEGRRRRRRLQGAVSRPLVRGRRRSVLRSGLQVVLAGQPNVGKSSRLNRLAREDLAIVTEIPGPTRDAVRQTIQVEGVPVNIIDTAGLRDPADKVEAIGIARTWEGIERADAMLLVVDAREGVSAADVAIVERLPRKLKPATVFNKIDLS